MKRLILTTVGIAFILNTPLFAQQASQNIPVLPVVLESDSPDDWYLRGDGYLQRQVEPTIAVSTRNPDHVLSFFVDYRAVDVPDDIGLGEGTQTFALEMKAGNLMLAGLIPLPQIPSFEEPPVAAAEAWVGGSASHDGGLTWSGFFMPGASFDGSVISAESPVYGLEAATDPVAVAGPCGYLYVAFMAFTRGDQSKLVVARFQDLNDSESGKTWQYQGTWEIESGNNATNGYFLDKPHIALDIFRDASDFSTYGPNFSAEECGHRVYTSYSTFNGLDKDGKFQSKMNFAESVDRGETWDKSRIQQPYTQNQGSFIAVDPRPGTPKGSGGGTVYLVWRHFYSPDAIVMIKTTDYGKKWSKPVELTGDIPMQTFDQPTISAIDGYDGSPDELTFRSNAFPTAVVTPEGPKGTVFVAWQERVNIDPFSGDDPNTGLPYFGRPYPDGSPRIVMVRSTDGGNTWKDIYDNPGGRVAVDFGDRDEPCSVVDPDHPYFEDPCVPEPGFGALPDPRFSGPQVQPWLSFGGGKLALGYSEARGFLGDGPVGVGHGVLSGLDPGFISGIDRVVDFRVALLNPTSGIPIGTTQVSRYPISADAELDDGEQAWDIAPVAPELCDATGLDEYCQPSLNLANKNHSGAGRSAFMGDYPGMSPIVQFVYDYNEGTEAWEWRWATDPADVPYQAFHVVFADNRHLIPPVIPTAAQGYAEWERYPTYDYPPKPPDFECSNPGSRNTDVLTAKVNAELVLSAPTTYKQGSPADPKWGYPISVFNRSGEDRYYRLEIVDGINSASFVVDPDRPDFEGDLDSHFRGVVKIFAYSSISQMVYVLSGATEQILIEVTQVQGCDENYEGCTAVPWGEQGFVTLNPDPSNPDVAGSEEQKVIIVNEGVEVYESDVDLLAVNPFVRNPFVRNPFVRNPFVRNPFVRNSAIDENAPPLKVIDTTWSVQATGDSGAGSYLPLINIDNADQFLKNYAFQLLVYKNASHGIVDGCESLNVSDTQILSNVWQAPNDAENPFVRNPFVRNPFVRNPFVRNPFVRNAAFTMAPADGVTEGFQKGANQSGSKNLSFDEDGTLRVPRVPEKIYVTLRAFQLNPIVGNDLEYLPEIDEPAFTAVPTRCDPEDPEEDCVRSLSPDLLPTALSVDNPDSTNPNLVNPVPAGSTLIFNFSVTNQGNVPAEAENRPLRHGFYLSTNAEVELGLNDMPLPDGDDTFLSFVPSQSSTLVSGGSETFSAIQVGIPGTIDSGQYYLILFVDDYREVSEVNEPNNQHAIPIEIIKINHAPTFTAGGAVVALEDSGSYSAVWATEIEDGDEETQELTFVLNPDSDPELFAAGPSLDATTGYLTFTLADDANGVADLTVELTDDGGTTYGGIDTSEATPLSISVTPVNDAPSFVKGADQTVDEDAGVQTETGWATAVSKGPNDESGQILTFAVSNDDNSLFAVQPEVTADGTLTYTPAADANGNATVTVSLSDNGGTDNGGSDSSAEQTFTITIKPVNDAPSFVKGADLTLDEDAVAQIITGWATDVSAGPEDESQQTLTFIVSNSDNLLFEQQPAISPEGTLTFEPAPNKSGSATVTVSLSDGFDTSPPQDFTITLTEIDDPPVITDVIFAEVIEDTPTSGHVVVSDPDSTSFTFTVTQAPQHGTVSMNETTGEFTYTPNPNSNQEDSFEITVTDTTSETGSVTVTVSITPVNDPPVAENDGMTVYTNGGPVAIEVLSNDSDVDGDTLVVSSITQPSVGTAATDGIQVIYTPVPGTSGTFPFTYSVSDGNGGNATATVTITAINPLPVWEFVGLLSPWSSNYSMRLGSVLPMKWYYTVDGVEIDSSMANPRIDVYRLSKCTGGVESNDPIFSEDYGSGSSDWQGVSDWHYNLDTDRPVFDKGCYNIYVKSQYTGQTSVPFQLRLK